MMSRVKKILGLVLGGILFGVSAVTAMLLFLPAAEKITGVKLRSQTQVTLPSGEGGEEETEVSTPQVSSVPEDSNTEEPSRALHYYEHLYEEILQKTVEPRKALVQVSALQEGENLLDESLLHLGDEEGIVFLQGESDYYILCTCTSLLKSDKILVTFSGGDSARGVLCKADERTGLAVVRVPAENLDENREEKIKPVVLSDSDSLPQGKPVIAIGSLQGDPDGVGYGMVTSVSGKLRVADAQYPLLRTDMRGSVNGTGVLLDVRGDVIGFILPAKEEESMLRAVSIEALRPLIQALSNGEEIRYLGIRGIDVTGQRAKELEIPEGIYVESVEDGSPAMMAGVLKGDIITGLEEEDVRTMDAYTEVLQNLSVGSRIGVSLWRRDAEGIYAETELSMTVEGK